MCSPKCSLVLQKLKQLSPEGTRLLPVWPARWTVRTGAIDAVLRNYAAIIQAQVQIAEESHDDYGRRANGLYHSLKDLTPSLD